ncbi:DUF806 family protein [Periweissella fabalis]|uniref:DUF806 family protein n=1 Tax=Periweissella fabalis TaxID=1070421 RepID=A0A7X6S466_9LACO|nr:DUF806 family protein [Periweissella fabalis]MCM0598319.1 DUF806 family protein [Periweissella fabalis]NKZ24951.1 DUF806 family protein [Periweissella fabalis]
MRATIELQNNLAKFPMADLITNIYADSVPPDENDGAESTDLVITESLNTPSTFGNNTFNQLDQTLQVAIYYSIDFEQDSQIFEISLYKFLETIGWRIKNVQGTYFDELTSQPVRVFQVQRLVGFEV